MLLKKMNKNLLVFLMCMLMPASVVVAGSDSLWNKLSAIAANNWIEIESLTQHEITQLGKLSEAGDANAQYALGMIYKTKHEHEKAEIWLKQAAEQGHAPARYSYNKNAEGHPDVAELSW